MAYACTNYSSIFRKPRGMFFSLDDKGQMASMVCALERVLGTRREGFGDWQRVGLGMYVSARV